MPDVTTTTAPTGMETTSGSEGTLSTWAGPYVTTMLGQAAALGPQYVDQDPNSPTYGKTIGTPFQAYDATQAKSYGDIAKNLVAGTPTGYENFLKGLGSLTTPSQFATAETNLENIYSGLSNVIPTVGTVSSYMNPYLEAVLDPQKREAQKQADIARNEMQSRMAKAGAYGGSRQAIMESEGTRNLQTLLSDITGKGYSGAWEAAQKQRQADIDAALRGYGAQTTAMQGLGTLGQQEGAYGLEAGKLGLTGLEKARQIEQEGLTAAYNQFLREEQYPKEQLKFMRDMISGIPGIAASSFYQPAPSMASSAAGGALTAAQLLSILSQLPGMKP